MTTTTPDTLPVFQFEDFARKRPFSSFLPGVAGHLGIPMWVFYVNRGQAITSFGIESKDSAIMEFQSASKAYMRTAHEGFRTFVKWKRGDLSGFYEPFSFYPPSEVRDTTASMEVSMSELRLREDNRELGLTTEVAYFTIPNEPFAALARKTTLSNMGDDALQIEVLDGMSRLVPFGADNGGLKNVGRTLEAWMRVFHLESGLPFFRMAATPEDSAEVQDIKAGHFVLAFTEADDRIVSLSPFVDPSIVFGANTTLTTPDAFMRHSLKDMRVSQQITVGKTPCAFVGHRSRLEPGEELTLYALFGHVKGYDNIVEARHGLESPEYFARRRSENQAIIQSLTSVVATKTADLRFDAYVRQTFLDNVLRGGWPILLAGQPFHIYSRKHGDPERDYNHFSLAAEFYSQGNGNFRDVCQNRRCDVLLEPRVGSHNIRQFLSLVQLDGYNPLLIQGMSYQLSQKQAGPLGELTDVPAMLASIIDESFSPGSLLKRVQEQGLDLKVSYQDFIERVLRDGLPKFQASFGEGFWVDHWTYLLDLVENFLAVFPDKKREVLLERIYFYKSPAEVRPRHQRYALTKRGLRQYDAISHKGEAGWASTTADEFCSTTVFGKFLLLAILKFGTRDAAGMGIEMEAGKPGWYDALNGLPGLFGSSMPEVYELLRLIRFLRAFLAESGQRVDFLLPVEVADLFQQLAELTKKEKDAFLWWEGANDLRETYRRGVYKDGLSGEEVEVSASIIDSRLDLFHECLQEGILRSADFAQNSLTPTYFRHQVTDFKEVEEEGRSGVCAKGFHPIPLPAFLEGAVRSMKIASKEKAKEIYDAVKASTLYDQALGMYKLNAPLAAEPHEIGRARAFTPGWLENESIWLHMEYKYLLELLKVGLYEEFFDEFKHCLIPFQPPERYGRSPLENSSFLVSSAHPDVGLHGSGFVARFSGASAEFLEMWLLMMAGKAPFQFQSGELILALRPILPAWFFDDRNQVRFTFLGAIPVTYHNPQRMDTWTRVPQRIVVAFSETQPIEFHGADIPAPYSSQVRELKAETIDVYLD